jgi:hypothetical protein
MASCNKSYQIWKNIEFAPVVLNGVINIMPLQDVLVENKNDLLDLHQKGVNTISDNSSSIMQFEMERSYSNPNLSKIEKYYDDDISDIYDDEKDNKLDYRNIIGADDDRESISSSSSENSKIRRMKDFQYLLDEGNAVNEEIDRAIAKDYTSRQQKKSHVRRPCAQECNPKGSVEFVLLKFIIIWLIIRSTY